MPIVTVRYWAAAKDAAGVAEETVDAANLAAALEAALAALAAGPLPGDRAERLRLVLARSSFLIDGEPVGMRPHQTVGLADHAVVEVLPPFAGG